MAQHNRIDSAFGNLLSIIDPQWSGRSQEEQASWTDWYDRTANAISRQFARSFRDPIHDASDVVQEILLKLFVKFSEADAPTRLLTERPCMRNLMEWKALDRFDWENASRRSSHRRRPLPDDSVGLPSRDGLSPDRYVELADLEQAFRRKIDDPDDREAYRLFRKGRHHRDVARALGRKVRETKALRDRLADSLRAELVRS